MYSSYCRHSLFCTKKTILSVCVFWIINVNHYGAMLDTQSKTKQKANRLFDTRIHKQKNLQHFPFVKDLTLMSSCNPTGVFCHMVLILLSPPPPIFHWSVLFFFVHKTSFNVGPVRGGFTWILVLNKRMAISVLTICTTDVCKSRSPWFDCTSRRGWKHELEFRCAGT